MALKKSFCSFGCESLLIYLVTSPNIWSKWTILLFFIETDAQSLP